MRMNYRFEWILHGKWQLLDRQCGACRVVPDTNLQAGQTILSQANQTNQSVLRLLE